jgi:FHA domain-containing protein
MTGSTYSCLKCGQASTEADYCSECGARIEGAAAHPAPTALAAPAPAPLPTAVAAGDLCPTCQTPRPSPGARFCEVCRYDFVKQSAGEPPLAAPPPASAAESTSAMPDPSLAATVELAPTPAANPAPVVPSAAGPVAGTKWDVVIAVDPDLDVEPEPGLEPPEEPERRIPLDQAENLVGRRSDAQNIVPEVRPHDPGVSRRHAKLLLRPDGSVAILDLESANGTFVNGEPILAGVARPLTADDVVTMGRWTRLRLAPREL